MSVAPQPANPVPVQGLLDTMERLSAILDAENAALAACRPGAIAQSIEEKQSLGRTFERQMQQIGPFPDALTPLAPQVRDRFIDRARRFRELVAINQSALEAAQRTADRIITHIVEAVRTEASRQPTHYSRPTMARPRNMATPVSIRINQVF